jgi:hypothetical protein
LLGRGTASSQFKLVDYDRKTQSVRWTFAQQINPTLLEQIYDKNFDLAVATLLDHFLSVAGNADEAAAPQEIREKADIRPDSSRREPNENEWLSNTLTVSVKL